MYWPGISKQIVCQINTRLAVNNHTLNWQVLETEVFSLAWEQPRAEADCCRYTAFLSPV